MKKKILILDDDEKFSNDLKYNLEQLDGDFFKQFGFEIEGLEVLTADNSDEAFKIIQKQKDIVLLILDIELRGESEGHQAYQKMFFAGRPIPAIVVSAFTQSPSKQSSIRSMGVSVIIDKFGSENLTEDVAKSICEVLRQPSNRIHQLRVFVERLKIYNHVVEVDGDKKSIVDWFQTIITEKIQPELEALIIQKITEKCIDAFKLEDDHGKGFLRSE